MSEGAMFSLLFHTGYATVRNVSRSSDGDVKLRLDYPNAQAMRLVTEGILNYFGSSLTFSALVQKSKEAVDCLHASPPDVAGFFKVVNEVIASMSSRALKDIRRYEGFYEMIFYLVQRIDGRRERQPEPNLARGHPDIVITLKKPHRTFTTAPARPKLFFSTSSWQIVRNSSIISSA